MHTTSTAARRQALAAGLDSPEASVRLRAALAAGSDPDDRLLEPLVRRCAIEPDPFVRDMLSWALTRLPPATTLPRVRRELDAEPAQARSQALHTLSKIGDRGAAAWITPALLRDPDDEVARTAWRAAVALVPEQGRPRLAEHLVTQLGRGGPDLRRSLSRALVDLGDVAVPALGRAAAGPEPAVAEHARATELLRQDPAAGFEAAVHEARRLAALGAGAPVGASGAAAGC